MAHSVRVHRAGLAVVALASVLLLTGCNPGGGAAESYSGLPVSDSAAAAEGEGGEAEGEGESAGHAGDAVHIDEEALAEGKPQVTWLNEGTQIALVMGGSSSCPPVGEQIRVLDEAGDGNRVAIDLVQRPEDEICTADFVPHTTVFWTPTYVTTTEPLEVEVAGNTVTVPVK
ncbi:hypothetical protein ACFWN7_10165 [Agromyces sp. NPDC058484]|uniref:hypothetical protein n=1 Tax=Agromyces sp. NPDC058484 TaxID=3346524 RepID=UPI003667A2C1